MPRPAHFVLVMALAAAAACTGDNASPSPTSVPTDATTTTIRPDDGVMLLGVVAPGVGSAANIGISVKDAVELAADEINAAGGVNGQRVRVVAREEGDNEATAVVAMQDLVLLGADAIIGPTSSLNALGSLGVAVKGGVLTCSPTATALALDDFPDGGLFVRTSPSDSLEAAAMARLVDESGSADATVVYLDDPYGRPFADAARVALQAQGTQIAASVGFTASEESIAAAVSAVVTAGSRTLVVIADDTSGPQVVHAIDDAFEGTPPTFVVNDAQRRPAAASQPYDRSLAARVQGASPLAFATDGTFLDTLTARDAAATGLFAHNAYDCANLIALAAVAADTLHSGPIAAAIPGVSSGGTTCNTFATCSAALAEGRNIDYEGPSGALAIGPAGDPTVAVFERFGFDDSGRDVGNGSIVVGDG